MSTTSIRRKALSTAIVSAVLLLSTTEVMAQAAARAQEQREARQQQKTGKSNDAAKTETLYPEATRKAPELKASSKLSSKLQKMIDFYNDGKNPEARAAADEIIASPGANAYELALANQIAAQAAYAADDNAAAKAYLKKA